MVTFESKVTKGGNLKVSSQLREILRLYSGQRVTVHLDCTAPDEIKIPQEILDEAGICADNGLEIYADEGQIIINGLLRFFKEEEILYDEFMKEELASVALDDHLSDLYTNQSDIIVLFGCEKYSKKHWPQIEWKAIKTILSKNINKNRYKVLIFSIDGKLPPPLFPESDGYILLKETGDDIGKAVNFIVERYTKFMGGYYK